MELIGLMLSLLLAAPAVEAGQTTGRNGHGLLGYGILMYDPACAFACRDTISPLLNCSTTSGNTMNKYKRMDMSGGSGNGPGVDLPPGNGWMVMPADPDCKAQNDFFLQTSAYCIYSRCQHVQISKLESYWATWLVGNHADQPVPKMSYGQALQAVGKPPTRPLNNSMLLNYTASVTDDQWVANFNADWNFALAEYTHERFGLVVFLTGAVIPVGLSLLRFFPWPAAWMNIVRYYLIDPPLFGSRHAVSALWGFGVVPTRGQALFIAYLWIVNIALTASGHKTVWPHSWFSSLSQEVESYVGNRTGLLSFANLPLVMLYAGRNNVLLWLTSWSRSTFILLHRWIAVICMLQAVLHSVIYLHMYTVGAVGYDYGSESRLPYWYWGIVGTLALALLIPASIQPFRTKLYEAFLVSHVVLSTLALIGCFLHIYYRFERQWGYETWLYISAGIWAFDRVARLAKAASNGIKRVHITILDDEYMQLDIAGVTASGHVYLHFPTLSTWKLWESHPFSVAASSVHHTFSDDDVERLQQRLFVGQGQAQVRGLEKPQGNLEISTSPPPSSEKVMSRSSGITLFVRRHSGITASLATNAAGSGTAASSAGLPVLVESSYMTRGLTVLQEESIDCRGFSNVICIAGGVGITTILPVLDELSRLTRHGSTAKVYWGVRSWALVHAVERLIESRDGDFGSGSEAGGAGTFKRQWGGVEVSLSVDQRFDAGQLVNSELSDREHSGTTFVVSGPASMADDVRSAIFSREKCATPLQVPRVRLVVESFSW
ncbi:ferric-chelate reductase [Trichoderma chlorosporum]